MSVSLHRGDALQDPVSAVPQLELRDSEMLRNDLQSARDEMMEIIR